MGAVSVNQLDPISPCLIQELLIVKLVNVKSQVVNVSAAIFRGLQLSCPDFFTREGVVFRNYGLRVRIPYTSSPNKFELLEKGLDDSSSNALLRILFLVTTFSLSIFSFHLHCIQS
jgi:hypothetical protein